VTLSEYERRVLGEMEQGFTLADHTRRRHRRHVICISALSAAGALVATALILTGLYLLPAVAGTAVAAVAGAGAGLLAAQLWLARRPATTQPARERVRRPSRPR
jgi:hypothetical protein